MPKRMVVVVCVLLVLVVGVGFTSFDSSIQSNMSLFENQLVTDGVNSIIDNSSRLGNVALKIQSVIDFIMSIIMTLVNKVIGIFN